MENRKFIILAIVISVFAAVGGFYAQQWYRTGGTLVRIDNQALNNSADNKNSVASENSKQRRPDFTLLDINKKSHSISEWDGKVILINFWATWCPPCVREVPTLDKLNTDFKDKGFVVIGIAIDSLAAVTDFVDPLDLQYPILLAEQQGIELSQIYGNRLGILPFSIIVDKHGNIVERHRGEITYEQVESLIKPLL
ncbi:MAG: TlpA family protein disulfide reductase [Gammaproteobacteria bacterium]